MNYAIAIFCVVRGKYIGESTTYLTLLKLLLLNYLLALGRAYKRDKFFKDFFTTTNYDTLLWRNIDTREEFSFWKKHN
jgi:hypothetical protein